MLVGKEVAVEVKNDSVLIGTLHSVNQDLNVKLTNVTVVDSNKYAKIGRSGSFYRLHAFEISYCNLK